MVLQQLFLGIIFFWVSDVWSSQNSTQWNSDLPVIKHGDTCVPDRLYRMDCNTCKCGLDNAMLCTKMACLPEEDLDKVKKISRKARDIGNNKEHNFPNLSPGDCIPGKIYQNGCYKCFCDDNKKATCSKVDSCNAEVKDNMPMMPVDVRPEFTVEELQSLPKLPSASSKCEPGVSYRVDCNTCLCMANRNMMCTRMLCLSTEDMNRLDAEKNSGTPCKNNKELQGTSCIKCNCVKSVSKCTAIPNCFPSTGRKLMHGRYEKTKPRLTLSLDKKEKCVPGSVYRENCNKCYCQKDATLRCTNKSCLNYVQSLKLKKQRILLEKSGQ